MKPNLVLDTDTFNEVDDQFALAHLMLSPEKVNLEAVYAVPFSNRTVSDPEKGMEQSYDEIHRLYDLLPGVAHPPAFKGSRGYLTGKSNPQPSPAASDLVERALNKREGKLQVVAIGAATNVASAILLEPSICEHIEVIWLGGHGLHWPDTMEFNLSQDLFAARVLFDSGVALKWMPCCPVASHLLVSVAELEAFLEPHSRLGAYLTKMVRAHKTQTPGQVKEIWDIAASAWAIQPDWVRSISVSSPVLTNKQTWSPENGRHAIDMAIQLKRPAIFQDFYEKAMQADGISENGNGKSR